MTDAGPTGIVRGTPATWIITLGIGLLYGLQVLWGGPGSEPLLARMGALHGGSVLDGQLWRLVAGAMLHLDPAHVATNAVVLVAVGRPVELLLGTARWLLLFVGSILGGTVASLAFTPGISVGISGGLLGLLAACAVLALTRGDHLPARLRLLVRSATLLALAVTVIQSMQPGIDMAAHIGGAIAGGLIMAVPAMRPAELGRRASEELRIGGVFAGLVLGLATLLGVAGGDGWAVMDAPSLSMRSWGGVRLPMPQLSPRGLATVNEGQRAQLFGRIGDTAVVALGVRQVADAAVARDIVRRLSREWVTGAPAEGFSPLPDGLESAADRITGRFVGPDARQLEVAVVALGDRVVRIEVAARRGHGPQWAGVAARMAAEVVPAPL